MSEREVPRSIRRETSFHSDTIDREAIEGTLYYLTERAANTMRRQGLEARHSRGEDPLLGFDRGERHTEAAPVDPARLRALRARARHPSRDPCSTGRPAPRGGRPHGVPAGPRCAPGASLRNAEGAGTGASMAGRVVSSVRRERRLLDSLDSIRGRYGYSSVVCGKSLAFPRNRRAGRPRLRPEDIETHEVRLDVLLRWAPFRSASHDPSRSEIGSSPSLQGPGWAPFRAASHGPT